MYVCMYTHIHVYVHIHIYMYICMCVCVYCIHTRMLVLTKGELEPVLTLKFHINLYICTCCLIQVYKAMPLCRVPK